MFKFCEDTKNVARTINYTPMKSELAINDCFSAQQAQKVASCSVQVKHCIRIGRIKCIVRQQQEVKIFIIEIKFLTGPDGY